MVLTSHLSCHLLGGSRRICIVGLLLLLLAVTSRGFLAIPSWLPPTEGQYMFAADEMQQMCVERL